MKQIFKSSSRATMLFGLGLAVLAVAAIISLGGCTKTIEGNVYPNKPPVVQFANIPPDSSEFSTNPLVYWYGTDEDGLIASYRYYIATVSQMGGMTPEDYIASVPDSDWTYVLVDSTQSNPRTEGTIPLIADTAHPVLGIVSQWVFLQAFDREGAASTVVYRLFSRNDNPPTTDILDYYSSLPFVNSKQAGGVVTGIRLNWQGQDKLDYPTNPPPFQFQWRLYGPYTKAEDSTVLADFVKTVFQSNDGTIYLPGETLFVCDTTADSVSCDTFVVGPDDSIPSYLGSHEPYFDIDDPAFAGSQYDHYTLQSCADKGCTIPGDSCCTDPWTYNTSDTLYNAFHSLSSDVTITRWFIFWIRSRDDARVPDPTPAFDTLRVIDPKYERDVLLIDYAFFSSGSSPAFRVIDSAKAFWYNALHNWKPNVLFDTTKYAGDYHDYVFARSGFPNGVPLDTLLQYKTLILYNDGVINAGLADANAAPIYKSIDAGVNVWLTARCPIYGTLNDLQTPVIQAITRNEGPEYAYFFRVNRMVFSGWWKHHASGGIFPGGVPPIFDVQDCVGAYSLDTTQWPNLFYDSVKVRTNFYYTYGGGVFNPSLPWLPEIDWSEAGLGAQVMYLYRSWYGLEGKSHPLGVQPSPNGPFDYNMEGAPCGHRFNSGLFKTVHFNFTPLALDNSDGSVQKLVNLVMDYIYQPVPVKVTDNRYSDSPVKLSVSEERARYWRHCDEVTLENGGKLSKTALANLYR